MRAWGGDEVQDKEREAVGEERTTWEAEMAALWATDATYCRCSPGTQGQGGIGPASNNT